MSDIPKEPSRWGKLDELSDHELHQMKSDMHLFATYAGKIASRSTNRAKALQGEQDRRKNEQRQRPRPVVEPPTIADHAIVRYLERVKGLDMRAIEQEMWSNIEQGEVFLSDNMIAHDGFVYVRRPQSNFIVTVLPADELTDEDVAYSDKMAAQDI